MCCFPVFTGVCEGTFVGDSDKIVLVYGIFRLWNSNAFFLVLPRAHFY